MNKSITKNQYNLLVKIQDYCAAQWNVLESLEEIAAEITKEKNLSFDFIYNGCDLEEMLEALNIKVEK